MFWMNRYMERAEGLLRVLYTNYILSLDKGTYGHHSWKPVLQMFGNLKEEEINTFEYTTTSSLQYLVTRQSNINSLRCLINRARENARGMQDHITKEVWEEVNLIYHTVNHSDLERKLASADALATIDQLLKLCLTYVGVTDTTMPRGMGWSYMSMGRFIDHKDILFWRNLLLSLSGYELHLKNYQNNATNANVINQVVFNSQFPRSIIYSLSRLGKYLKDVLDENQPAQKEMLNREFGRIYSRVQFADENSIKEITLQRFLQETKQDLLRFSHVLGQQFFSYA